MYSCNGHGKIVSKNDVTDVVELPYPDDKETPILPQIAGYILPPIETWTKFEETLEDRDKQIYKTHWGTTFGTQDVAGTKTATEVNADKQPLENQLNKYADFAEYVEWKFSEWILNLWDVSKIDKNESKITVNLGRRFIIESYDILLKRYEEGVLAEDNSVILDKLFSEYLSAKYRNNPIDLQISLLRAKVEPYLHLTLKQTLDIFGKEEAQRKALFSKWWNTIANISGTEEGLVSKYNLWFDENKPKIVEVKI